MIIGNRKTFYIEVGEFNDQMISLDVFVDQVKINIIDNTHYIHALHSAVYSEINRFNIDENLFRFSEKIVGSSVFDKYFYLKSYIDEEFDPDYFKVLSWGPPLWDSTSYLVPYENQVFLVSQMKNATNDLTNTKVGFVNYFYYIKTLNDFLDSLS